MRNFEDLKEITGLLSKMEERRKVALEVSFVGIWDWDIVNDNLYWDERMFEIYDCSPGDFENNYDAWRDRVHPKDLIKTETEINKCLADESYRYFYRFRVMHQGEWRWVVGVGNCVGKNGEPIRMIGVNILEDKGSGFKCPILNDACPINPRPRVSDNQ